jgi:uncharacterized protein
MTADERDQLMQFLTSLRQARPQPKDPVADALIRDALAQQPDALYRLVQRCMALQLALDAATAQANGSLASGEASTASAKPNDWARGLLTQVGGTALGVTAGVVAGGWLLQGLSDDSFWDGDIA